jgi:hypothetical protein
MRGAMKVMAGQGIGGRLRMMQQLTQMGAMEGRMPKLGKGTTRYNPQRDDKKKKRRRR